MFIKWPKIVKSYVNSIPAKKKNIEGPKNSMAFLRTLVVVYTIQVRIMSTCCCPVQIFAINKGYLQHYKICTLRKMEPWREIKLSGSNEYLCFETNNSRT